MMLSTTARRRSLDDFPWTMLLDFKNFRRLRGAFDFFLDDQSSYRSSNLLENASKKQAGYMYTK